MCNLGLFQATTHTAAAWQPLAEQMVRVSGSFGEFTPQPYVPPRERSVALFRATSPTPAADMTTPGSHGGSRPASVRRSDGGCGARTQYVMGNGARCSRTA
ncbi:hypothetical protein GCM10010341_25140 [Streptomyces noursei]|nr:hypothetical protein GCM10010341_25140 [Streptomyces noursei]